MSSDDLYARHADTIEAILAYTRRTNRLSADAGEEFTSWARLRLLEDNAAILRKFQGLSSIRTYLVTVVQRLFLDWRNAEWGRWRPTLDARRLGPLAIELEKLVLRDEVPFDEAVQALVRRGIAQSADECDRVWGELPRRPRRRRAGEQVLAGLPGQAPPDPVADEEDHQSASRAAAALAEALPALTPAEQLIIRLRYFEGFTVARIATLIGEEQKPLYRRYEQVLARLRVMLMAAGVTADEVRGLLGNPTVELDTVFRAAGVEKTESGPSSRTRAGGEA